MAAATIHELRLVTSSEEKGRHKQHKRSYNEEPSHTWINRNSKVGLDCKLNVTMQSLWIDACFNLSWVAEKPTSRSLTLLCTRNNKEIHNQGTAFVAFPQSQAAERVTHHEGASFVALLRACIKNKDLSRGITIHDDILKRGLLEQCSHALVAMYAKCGALAKAKALLDMLKTRDVVSWTALIAGYAREGRSQDALNCFERMQHEGILPNATTYACILKACGTIGAIDKGKQFHDEIVSQGLLQNNIVLGNALVDMYAKCGALAKAHCVLEELPSRDVVSWSALIAGYAQQGKGEEALNCFECMQHEGIHPDAVTFACILKACGTIGAIDKGRLIHDKIARRDLLENNILLGTALVDMYAKCGALAEAQHVLEELPFRDVVSWNALIAGYAQQSQGEQALNCFERMQCEHISPNAVTFTCTLKACGNMGAADKGKQIHDEIMRQGLLQNNIVLGTALVDMYAKCGALEKAQRVLDELPFRDVVSWSALIAGYAQQGQGERAMNCFERMQHEGIPPDAVTFSCVLNVCNHLGLLEKGHMFFATMSTKYGVKPNLEGYICMIDLLGRAGHLERAVKLIREMPSSDNSAIWHALLGACCKWGDVNVGRWAFEQAVQVDKSDGAAYVLMANIYGAAGLQENAKKIEAMRMENKARKKPGCSLWIDLSEDLPALSAGNMLKANVST